jgi:hypothetical protein
MNDFIRGCAYGSIFVILCVALLTSCSTRSIVITPGCVNATSSAFLYCPEASVVRIADGNRTVDMVGAESGVGKALTGMLEGLR